MNTASAGSISQVVCDSLTLNGFTYTSSGTYTQTLTNIAGCDSTLTINLLLHASTSSFLTQTACNSYTLNAQTYTASGVYTQNFTNAVNCDSIVHLNLTIHQATSFALAQSACDSLTLNGITYTSSGAYTQTFVNAQGCDSTLHLQLSITSINNAVTQNGITLQAAAGISGYQWINCPSYNLISGANASAYTAVSNGSYAVILTQNGCIDTSACYTITDVSASAITYADQVFCYPNPVSDYLQLTIPATYNHAHLFILNSLGQVIDQLSIQGSSTCSIPVQSLAPGIYLLVLEQNGQPIRTRFTKQ